MRLVEQAMVQFINNSCGGTGAYTLVYGAMQQLRRIFSSLLANGYTVTVKRCKCMYKNDQRNNFNSSGPNANAGVSNAILVTVVRELYK